MGCTNFPLPNLCYIGLSGNRFASSCNFSFQRFSFPYLHNILFPLVDLLLLSLAFMLEAFLGYLVILTACDEELALSALMDLVDPELYPGVI